LTSREIFPTSFQVHLKAISFDSIPVRTAALVVAAIVVIIAVFSFIWGLANSASLWANEKELGALLAELSPGDPQTHFTSARQHEQTFEPGNVATALAEYEKSAALSPYNYLIWLELGSARVRAGETPGAEAAFRRALELAPNYARAHWALGNLLLRNGNDDEAYAEIRKAIERDPTFAAPAAALALQMADGDPTAVRSRFEGLPHGNAALASLLAGQKRFDEAAAVWNSVSIRPGDVKLFETMQGLKRMFFDGKRFRDAAAIAAQQNAGIDAPTVERVTNPDFELPVKTEGAGEFDWRVAQSNYPQIGVTDAHKRSGRYSLITLFNSLDPKNFKGFSQVVAVQPGRTYDLSVAYRADVKSKVPFHWDVLSAVDSKRLALSDALAPSTDWTTVTTRFTVPADADGIEIRFVRGDCIAAACAASGSFWFDDISITTK
jgi:tetratricopeptide (TPR) repeat protein